MTRKILTSINEGAVRTLPVILIGAFALGVCQVKCVSFFKFLVVELFDHLFAY